MRFSAKLLIRRTHTFFADVTDKNVRVVAFAQCIVKTRHVVATVIEPTDRHDVIVVGGSCAAHAHLATITQSASARLEWQNINLFGYEDHNKML